MWDFENVNFLDKLRIFVPVCCTCSLTAPFYPFIAHTGAPISSLVSLHKMLNQPRSLSFNQGVSPIYGEAQKKYYSSLFP